MTLIRPRVLLFALALAGCGDGAGAPAATPGALQIEIGGLDRLEQAIAARRGHPLLVNFWATWCPPCVAELPDLMRVAADYEPRGVGVLGVSFDLMLPGKAPDATRELVRSFLEQRKLALSTVLYDAPDFDALNARFELPGAIPVTLAFDRAGKLVDRQEGEGTRERFEELARKALGD